MNNSDSIAVKFDNMARFPKNDELGLFKNYDKILEETRRRIIEHNGQYILDIGCGTGNLCGELNETYSIIGMDKNLEMLKRAKEKYQHINFKIGNFLDTPFKENFFDIVVSTFVFHILNEEEKRIAIKNMLKYIKDNGKIIIVDYMFLDSKEKDEYKKNFNLNKREDLWDFISSKHYTNIEELKNHIVKFNYNIIIQHIVNFTWIIEITKSKGLLDNC
ncbi:class I SAM-dependent methyltransferase [Clostridium sp. SHJSY1]|uniref:class I SAM-dependent methyltransferase n=1 Tax=Clostridium sp. SHJSY1 TaxID=2942483 RepID=UPI00287515F5|nr:class I SAM-dependent methyltransferase [Clostridium sp. SHJSY1]MDS0524577.1 class I SAM-dependent methyltransferase [Clostridium sp. SHJSY1]